MAIEEKVKLDTDGVTKPSKKAADAVAKLEKAILKVRAAKLAQVKTAQKQAAKEEALTRKHFQTIKKNQDRARKAEDAAFKAKGQAHNKEDKQDDKAKGNALAIAGAIIGIGVAAVAASVGVAKLGAEFLDLASNALDARRGAVGLMDMLSGRGEKTLQAVDRLSGALGVSLGEGREQFDKFRSAGLDNKQSAALMKLRADVEAVTGSSARADEAVEKVLAAKKAKGSVEDQMKAIAKSAKTMGQGMDAAQKSAGTLGGQLKRLKDLPARALDAMVADPEVASTLDSIGVSIGKTMKEIASSPEAAKFLGQLKSAFLAIGKAVATLIPLVAPFLKTLMAAAAPVVGVISKIATAFTDWASKGENMKILETAMKMAAKAVVAFVIAIGVLGAIALTVGAYIAGLAAVPFAVAAAIGAAAMLLKDKASEWYEAGVEMVNGFIDGITSMVGDAISSVKELGAKAAGALKAALQIKSPSKLFEKFGKFTVEGFNQGIDKTAPSTADAVGGMVAPPSAQAKPSGGSGPIFNLTLNVVAGAGATKQDGENMAAGLVPMIRREVEAFFSTMVPA